jgi:hypothetical protein
MKKVTVNIENIKWAANENGMVKDLPNALIRREFLMEDDQNVEGYIANWLADTFDKHEGFDVTIVDTENSPFLEDVLEGIEIENTDALIWKDLEDRIKQGMPGYQIELFDVEDFPGSIEMGCQVAEVINCYAKDGIEEVRTGQWCTLSEDTFVVVVAIKTTKQN